MINGQISMWMDSLEHRRSYPAVNAEKKVNYAIVGGGLSGLWTAYHLKKKFPSVDVAVFEAGRVASGASGRAAGWLSGKPVGVRENLARIGGRSGVIRVEEILRESIDHIVNIFDSNEKDIGAYKGGSLQVARSESEAGRIRNLVASARRWDVPEESMHLLDSSETRDRVRISRATLGAFSADMVRVDPARMTNALAEIVLEMGVSIYEQSRVVPKPGHVPTANGHPIHADSFVIATEGYTSQLPGMKRAMLPMNSSLIATQPLSDREWERVGWDNAEGLSGAAHTYFYSARTPDGRIAIGGRGNPYRFGSGYDSNGVVDVPTVKSLHTMLSDLFPQLDTRVEYAWCGVIGVSRDWSPFVFRDPTDGSVTLGGYAGQGLTAAYLAGRIAASLASETNDEYAQLPWVRDLPRKWEPEPLRWIGANSLYRVYSVADKLEEWSGNGKTAVSAKIADRISGRTARSAH